MKSLLILRHAKSSWKDMALTDHDRPLNARGKRDAPLMGQLLRRNDLIPDLILSSTARRAIRTANIMADELDYSEPVTATRDFYLASPDEYLAYLCRLPNEHQTVMLVGHNPGMEELITDLTGAYEVMPTATVAHITLPIDDWQDLNEGVEGTLRSIWRPKETLTS